MKFLIGLTATRALASAGQAVSLLLLARSTDPSTFGDLASFLGLGLFLVVASDIGASSLILKYSRLAGGVAKQAQAVWLYRVGMYVLILAIVLAASVYLVTSGNAIGVCAVAVWIVSDKYSEIRVIYLLSQRRDSAASFVILVRRLVPVAIQALLLAVGIDGLMSYSGSLVLGVVVLIAVLGTMRIRLPFARSTDGALRSEALHFWTSAMSSQSRELDTPIVSAISGASVGAFYALGFRIAKPFSLFSVSLAQVILRTDVRSNHSKIKRVSYGIHACTVVGTAVLAVLSPFMERLVVIGLGDSYEGAGLVVGLAVALSIPHAMCSPLGSILQARGQQRSVSRVGVFSAVLGLLGVVVGALAWGAVGAVVLAGAVYAAKYLVLGGLVQSGHGRPAVCDAS